MSDFPNIGKMDRKITIETATETIQNSGERVRSWATFAKVWASIDNTGGDKKEEDEKLTAISDYKFIIRHLSGLTSDMRVLFDETYYTIRSVVETGRKKFIVIDTDERTGVRQITIDTSTITVDSTLITADQIIN